MELHGEGDGWWKEITFDMARVCNYISKCKLSMERYRKVRQIWMIHQWNAFAGRKKVGSLPESWRLFISSFFLSFTFGLSVSSYIFSWDRGWQFDDFANEISFFIVEKKEMKYKYHEVFSAFPCDKILECISWSDLLDVLSAKVVLIRQLQSWQWRPYVSYSQSKIKEYCQIWILVRNQITLSLIRHFGVVLKVENLSIFPALFNNNSLIWLFKVHPCIIILSYANIHSIEF